MLLAPGPDVNIRSPGSCSGLSLRVALPDYHRLLVKGVIAGSPAAQAGFLAGDVIEAVARGTDELRPDPGLQLAAVVKELGEPGQSFAVLIVRQGKPMRLTFLTRELY
jgi:C-terminal processing protease CtpA/Prc